MREIPMEESKALHKRALYKPGNTVNGCSMPCLNIMFFFSGFYFFPLILKL
jgi:hypothetical protein